MHHLPLQMPPLVSFANCDGDEDKIIQTAYEVFYQELLVALPKWRGQYVRILLQPTWRNKYEEGFKHCITAGDSNARELDMLRCERIRWIRAIIEADGHPSIDYFEVFTKGELRKHLWYNEEFLVVLAKRGAYHQFVTTFVTNWPRSKEEKRKQRDEWRRKNAP